MTVAPTFVPRALDLAKLAGRKSLFLFGPRRRGKPRWCATPCPGARLRPARRRCLCHAQPAAGPTRRGTGAVGSAGRSRRDPEAAGPARRGASPDRATPDPLRAHRLERAQTASGRRQPPRRPGAEPDAAPVHLSRARERIRAHQALDRGLLPSIYFSDSPREDLRAYVGTYLKEEIAAEALTRNVPAFSRFLEVAALSHGTMLNFATVASDAQVPVSTVREYFHILEDTLLARRPGLDEEPHAQGDQHREALLLRHRRGAAPAAPLGLARRSPEFGEAFESFIFHEFSTFIDYTA